MPAIRNKNCNYISNKEISITFDGKSYSAYDGDTIASALLRNNIRLIGRSFKYHRPRGIYTCGIEEPNALVQILNEHNEPNTRATIKRVYEGININSQNRWPSLSFDIGTINNILVDSDHDNKTLIAGLNNGTTYEFQVQSRLNNGLSSHSTVPVQALSLIHISEPTRPY